MHLYGPLSTSISIKLVYLEVLKALDTKSFDKRLQYQEKKQRFQICLLWSILRNHPPTLLYAISIQKNIDNYGRSGPLPTFNLVFSP